MNDLKMQKCNRNVLMMMNEKWQMAFLVFLVISRKVKGADVHM